MEAAWLQCAACRRLYDAGGYAGPPVPPGAAGPGMCPPCADGVFAAERDRLAGLGRRALAAEWEAERRARRAANPRWRPGVAPTRARPAGATARAPPGQVPAGPEGRAAGAFTRRVRGEDEEPPAPA